MPLVVVQRPVHEDRVERGIGDHDGHPVVGGDGLHDVDAPRLQFLHEGARGPAIGGGGGQLVIHDERPQAHSLASACQHLTLSQ